MHGFSLLQIKIVAYIGLDMILVLQIWYLSEELDIRSRKLSHSASYK